MEYKRLSKWESFAGYSRLLGNNTGSQEQESRKGRKEKEKL